MSNPDVRGPYLSGGYPGQVLIQDVSGSNRTVWTDQGNVGSLEPLTADRHYYVSPTGSDSENDGRSKETPFLSIEKAVNEIKKLDVGKYFAAVNLADGSYNAGIALPNLPYIERGFSDENAPFRIIGNQVNALNADLVILDHGFYVDGHWSVTALTVKTDEYASPFRVRPGGLLKLYGTVKCEGVPQTAGNMCKGIQVIGGELQIRGGLHFKTGKWDRAFLCLGGVIKNTLFAAIYTPNVQFAYTYIEMWGGLALFLGFQYPDQPTTAGIRYQLLAGATFINLMGAVLPGDQPGQCLGGSTYNFSAPAVQVPVGRDLYTMDSNTTFTNSGATALTVFTLPGSGMPGLKYSFYVGAAIGLKVVAAAGHTIRNGATAGAAAGNISSVAVGSHITLEAINPAATEWSVTSETGTWTLV